jgi:hypothetical protein
MSDARPIPASSGMAYLYAHRLYVEVGHRLPNGAEGPYLLPTMGSMQDRANGLPRIPVPRTSVNKGFSIRSFP